MWSSHTAKAINIETYTFIIHYFNAIISCIYQLFADLRHGTIAGHRTVPNDLYNFQFAFKVFYL